MMKPDLSIIIVNYNGEKFLSNCIDSIKKYVNCSHEIILIDNASSDDSLILTKNRFPLVHIIENKINCMLQVNQMRIDFLERFKQLIDEYNVGSQSVDEIFRKLIEFTKELDAEEKRYIREELESEEELAIFDMLTRPAMKLGKKEEKDVKRVARQLLDTLKREKIVLDWQKKQQTRAAVKLSIKEILDELPTVYTKKIYEDKCNQVYQYVYDRY